MRAFTYNSSCIMTLQQIFSVQHHLSQSILELMVLLQSVKHHADVSIYHNVHCLVSHIILRKRLLAALCSASCVCAT